MAKEKKIGVSFKKHKSSKYCYLNFKGKSTRFPYDVKKKHEKQEAVFIQSCIRYLHESLPEFSLKGIARKIDVFKGKMSENFQENIFYELGDILTHNQYVFLESRVNSKDDLFNRLNSFLDIRNVSSGQKKKYNLRNDYLNQISDESKIALKVYLKLVLFEKNGGSTNLTWLINTPVMLYLYFDFQLDLSVADFTSYPVPSIPVPIEKQREIIENELDLLREKLLKI